VVKEPSIDSLDRSIIECLKRSPRATNRETARALGVTEQTIAVRIRRLEEHHVMRVFGVLDMVAAGYRHHLAVGLRVADRDPAEIARELADLPAVRGITSCLGRFQLLVTVYARDERDVVDLLERSIGSIRGIERIEAHLVLEQLLHRVDWASLGKLGEIDLLAGADPSLDDLDLKIICALQVDGRTRFRELSRRLGRSEGTVRARLGRMEDRGACRLQTVADVRAGPGGSAAWLAIEANPDQMTRAAAAIARIPGMGFVATALGRFNLLAIALAPDREALARVVLRRAAAVAGVRSVEVWECVETFKHDYRIASLLPPARLPRRKRQAHPPRP